MSEIKFNDKILKNILKNLGGNTSRAIEKVAKRIKAEAQQNAAVDTSSMKLGIHIRVGHRVDEGDAARLAARNVNTDAVLVELPTPKDNNSAYIGPAVEHGLFVELGTSRQVAQPYLLPAVRRIERDMAQDFRQAATNGTS